MSPFLCSCLCLGSGKTCRELPGRFEAMQHMQPICHFLTPLSSSGTNLTALSLQHFVNTSRDLSSRGPSCLYCLFASLLCVHAGGKQSVVAWEHLTEPVFTTERDYVAVSSVVRWVTTIVNSIRLMLQLLIFSGYAACVGMMFQCRQLFNVAAQNGTLQRQGRKMFYASYLPEQI